MNTGVSDTKQGDPRERIEPLRAATLCPTCGESVESPDAGPCDGTHECLRREYDQYQAHCEAEYLAGLEREARLLDA